MTSLRGRIVKGLLIGLGTLFVVQWILVSIAIRQVTENYAAARLEHEIETLLAALQFAPDGQPQLDPAQVNPFYHRPFSGHYFRIAVSQSTLTSRSLWDWQLQVPDATPGQQIRLHVSGPQSQSLLTLVHGFQKRGVPLTVAVAEDFSEVDADIHRFQVGYAVLNLLFLAALAALTAWSASRSLRPLQTTRAELTALETGAIDSLDERVPREVQPLVREVNHLLELTRQRLQRSRKATGNLAHGLKTPLSVLSRLGAEPALKQAPALRRTLETQVARMHGLIERELKRARVAGSGPSATRFHAAAELPALVATLERLYQARGIRIEWQADPGHRFQGDREDMLELLGNLLDNACKWASHRVELVIENGPGLIARISDDGPGVEESRAQDLLQRGTRLDETAAGHGLGLAIVSDIVRQYEGTLELARSPTLGGLEVRVRLPAPGGD